MKKSVLALVAIATLCTATGAVASPDEQHFQIVRKAIDAKRTAAKHNQQQGKVNALPLWHPKLGHVTGRG